MDAPIQQCKAPMADDIKSPEKPSRLSSSFVIICHHMHVGRQPDRRQCLAELPFIRKPPAHGPLASQQYTVVEMHGAGDVSHALNAGSRKINDKEGGFAQTCIKFFGLEQEREQEQTLSKKLS